MYFLIIQKETHQCAGEVSFHRYKPDSKKAMFKSGIEYRVVEQFYLRTGFSTAPNRFTMGVGYEISSWTIDMAFATHETLPISAYISLKYNLIKN